MTTEPRKSGPLEEGYYFNKQEAAELMKWLFRTSRIHRMQVELLTPEEAFAAGGLLGIAFKMKADMNLTVDMGFDNDPTHL